jgi:HSP20 family protein
MPVTYWDPFREVNSLQHRLNSMLQDFNRNQSDDQSLTMGSFVPAVDVYEDEHKVSLKLEAPGIQPDAFDIQIENNTLTVRGERKFDREEKEENFHRIERRYGSFVRSFSLPATVDPNSVKASYENGVLRIDLAKRAEAKPRQIKVSVGSTQQPATIESKTGSSAPAEAAKKDAKPAAA